MINLDNKINRIWHPYTVWEDFPAGFYENKSKDKEKLLNKCIELFNNKKLFEEYCFKVINEWPYSCEHNLTCSSMNKIAYIGQAACCIYCGASSNITIDAWNTLNQDIQEISNQTAQKALDFFYKNLKNNDIELKEDL